MKLRTLALIGAGAWGLYRISQQTGVPHGVRPLEPFDLQRYLGRWYELARLDAGASRGLTDTSIEFSQSPHGQVQALHRGFDPQAWQWRHARASVRPAGRPDVGYLKISFIWPATASHVVVAADDDYRHAVACGHNREQLWLLARSPQVKSVVRAALLEQARVAGFDVDSLLWVDQRRNVAARRR